MRDSKGQELKAGDIIRWDTRGSNYRYYIICPDHRRGRTLQMVCLSEYKWKLSREVTETELEIHTTKVGTMPDIGKLLEGL